jgi:hypothetical protein
LLKSDQDRGDNGLFALEVLLATSYLGEHLCKY